MKQPPAPQERHPQTAGHCPLIALLFVEALRERCVIGRGRSRRGISIISCPRGEFRRLVFSARDLVRQNRAEPFTDQSHS